MRTLLIIFGGFALLAIGLYGSRFIGSGGDRNVVLAAQIFLPVWLALALANMWFGVTGAGYTVREELPIMLLIFAIPGAAAGFVWWKFS